MKQLLKGDKSKSQAEADRREEILKAALESFLKFGYSKTSIDDIAKEARLSRPLLYLKFKNKDDIFKGAFEYLVGNAYQRADEIMKQPGDTTKKLVAIYEVLILDAWDHLSGKPMAQEFYQTCVDKFPELSEKHEKAILRHVTAILGSREKAEIFTLAVVGFETDIPLTKVLRKRIELLALQFT